MAEKKILLSNLIDKLLLELCHGKSLDFGEGFDLGFRSATHFWLAHEAKRHMKDIDSINNDLENVPIMVLLDDDLLDYYVEMD